MSHSETKDKTNFFHDGIRWSLLFCMICCIGFVFGCDSNVAELETPPPPEVTVGKPIPQQVTEYEFFTGKVTPIEQVEVRARVNGYLEKVNFVSGQVVTKGQPLFDIDSRPYKAEYDQATATFVQAQARVARLESEFKRADPLLKSRAISLEEYEKTVADLKEAQAAMTASEAKIEAAKLNLAFTSISSPLDGVAGDRLVDVGNLVQGGQANNTLLTTIVAVNPINVAFDVDENTLQRVQLKVREGKIKSMKQGKIPIEVGLPIHDKEYPIPGLIQFIDNKVDPKTGTIRLKAECSNPKTEFGHHVMVPGMFVRVRVPIGDPQQLLLVPESCLGSDQGQRYLYLVQDGKAVRMNVSLGIQKDALRVINGLKLPTESEYKPLAPDAPIIVNGLQRVRPGLAVTVKASN